MRLAVSSAIAACIAFAELAIAGNARAMSREPTHIPAEPLGLAVQTLAKERGFQVVFDASEIDHHTTQGASGRLTSSEALAQLLHGTGFTFYKLSDTEVVIVPIANRALKTPAPSPQTQGEQSKEKAGGSFNRPFRVAQADSDRIQTAALTKAKQRDLSALQTVIVTAEKTRYGESVLNTPVPITVLSANNLVDTGHNSLQDYYTSVPGLNLTMGGNTGGVALVTIRGITTNLYQNPTVTSSIDDVPLGSSTLLGGGELIPDIDPSDLDRVEVLRGPQGTLYGGNSMGGLIRYVTAEPSTSGFAGSVQGGLSSIEDGSGLGYATRGNANIPVSDTVALRVSAFDRRDPGYVDNIQTGKTGVNSASADGGMFSALWRPSDAFTWSLNALVQRYHQDGSPQVNPSLGSLKQSLLATTGSDIIKDQVYWATETLDLGQAQLKSITSYGSYDYSDRLDYGLIGLDSISQSQFGVSGFLAEDHVRTNRFTQELRLYLSLGKQLDWLFGGFYDRERSNNSTNAFSVDPNTLAVAGYWGVVNEPQLYEEYAGFTNLTYRFNDRIDIQLGARESQIKQSEVTESTDLWVSVFGFAANAATPSETERAFTYLVTPRFKVSSNLMAYARFASGFRPGALNGVSPFFPVQSTPDKTQNYELGLKGDVLDHRLTFDTSLYYISWKNVQIELYSADAFSFYVTNESAAKSEGAELSVNWKPIGGTALNAWVSWNEAALTQAFPASSFAVGATGDRLPFSARLSGHISVDQSFPITGDVTGDAGIDWSYIGNRVGDFTVTPVRQLLPGYGQVNLHATVAYRSWTGELYINNVANKRGVLYGGIGSNYPDYFNYITPLTVGATITKSFR